MGVSSQHLYGMSECFTKCLFNMGFKLNNYDQCVANKMIEGTQCTIVWNVDDNKISHVNSQVVDQVITKIKKKFRKMTVKRGKEHVFVGMNISFIGDNKLKLTMKNYLEEAIQVFGEDVLVGAACWYFEKYRKGNFRKYRNKK